VLRHKAKKRGGPKKTAAHIPSCADKTHLPGAKSLAHSRDRTDLDRLRGDFGFVGYLLAARSRTQESCLSMQQPDPRAGVHFHGRDKAITAYRFLARRIRQRANAAKGGKSEQLNETARAFEKIAENFERVDERRPAPFRKYARLWLQSDYEKAAKWKARIRLASGAKQEVEATYQELLSREYDDPDGEINEIVRLMAAAFVMSFSAYARAGTNFSGIPPMPEQALSQTDSTSRQLAQFPADPPVRMHLNQAQTQTSPYDSPDFVVPPYEVQ
jgi:hypothetical protein